MPHLALIVEDDEPTRPMYYQILRKIGFDIIEAPDGAEALALLQTHTPTIVLLDIRLPHVNGLEVLAYIHSADHLRHTGTIIITAHSDYAKKVILSPNDQFLLKPVDARTIRDSVQRALSMLPAGS